MKQTSLGWPGTHHEASISAEGFRDPWCQKNFLRSRKMTPFNRPLSIFRNQSLVAPNKAVVVECTGLKPDWESESMPCFVSWLKIILSISLVTAGNTEIDL